MIEEHGGEVEKFIGDAVMAVFGLRRSWEDDAARAVRASLAMVTDLAELKKDLEPRYGVTLRMRVGVDTGDVICSTLGDRGDGGFVAVGPTVNRAARLQAAAAPDRILVSESTHRQVRGRFNLERREPLQLKDFEQPVVTYLVVSERPRSFQPRPGRWGGRRPDPHRRPRVELSALQEHFHDVIDEQRWRVVTVSAGGDTSGARA